MNRMVIAMVLNVTVAAVAGAAPTERRLHADQVAASSFLWTDWNRFQENYHPLYVSDDDPRTAWTEGSDGNGEGEWLRMQVSPMDGATRVRLKIRNGYQKSHSLFQKNTRVKDATLVLLPGGKSQKVTLTDQEGWQEVVVEQPAGKLAAIELHVETVYPGTKYTDLCISDIQIYVTAETPENPAFEKSKLDRVLAWKKERLAAAKAFASGAKELPLASGYQYHDRVDGNEGYDWQKCKEDRLCWLSDALARAAKLQAKHEDAFAHAKDALGGNLVPAKLAPTDSRDLPTVDGLYVPALFDGSEGRYGTGMELPIYGVVAALQADKLGALQLEGDDVKTTVEEAAAAKAPGCNSREGKLYSWILREKDADGRAAVRAALFVRCGQFNARDGKHVGAMAQVAVYDAAGHLELTVGEGYVASFAWAKVDGHDGIVAGEAIYGNGRVAELAAADQNAKR